MTEVIVILIMTEMTVILIMTKVTVRLIVGQAQTLHTRRGILIESIE